MSCVKALCLCITFALLLAGADSAKQTPFDVSGYVGTRRITDDDIEHEMRVQEYTAALFLSKSVGRWNFLSEIQVHNLKQGSIDGLPLGPRRAGAQVQTAWGNYRFRDSFQLRAGHQLVPTYWRLHRYQSTTLTVEDPLLDSNVFPASFDGVAAHGSHFGDLASVSYSVYGGSGNRISPVEEAGRFRRTAAIGSVVSVGLAPRRAVESLELGYSRFAERYSATSNNHAQGVQMHGERGRLTWLAEFAHSRFREVGVSRPFTRQGYYAQPSFRIRSNLFGVYRYDNLRMNLSDFQDHYRRHTAGVVYRPVPALSLKANYVRYSYRSDHLGGFTGINAAIVYFFRWQ